MVFPIPKEKGARIQSYYNGDEHSIEVWLPEEGTVAALVAKLEMLMRATFPGRLPRKNNVLFSALADTTGSTKWAAEAFIRNHMLPVDDVIHVRVWADSARNEAASVPQTHEESIDDDFRKALRPDPSDDGPHMALRRAHLQTLPSSATPSQRQAHGRAQDTVFAVMFQAVLCEVRERESDEDGEVREREDALAAPIDVPFLVAPGDPDGQLRAALRIVQREVRTTQSFSNLVSLASCTAAISIIKNSKMTRLSRAFFFQSALKFVPFRTKLALLQRLGATVPQALAASGSHTGMYHTAVTAVAAAEPSSTPPASPSPAAAELTSSEEELEARHVPPRRKRQAVRLSAAPAEEPTQATRRRIGSGSEGGGVSGDSGAETHGKKKRAAASKRQRQPRGKAKAKATRKR